jgi:hypothetical protein
MGLSNFFLLGWKYFGIASLAELQTLITKRGHLFAISTKCSRHYWAIDNFL